jgi:hypothetical protein
MKQPKDDTEMRQFRITRPEFYMTHGCLGKNDVTCRQGHYYMADNIQTAATNAFKDFPNDRFLDIQDLDRTTKVETYVNHAIQRLPS